MSEWTGEYITEPEEPTDYLGTYAWTKGWVFGLPDEGQLSSSSCGAMPFRDGTLEHGLCAKKCLRGEDWAWIATWIDMHHGMFSRRVFEDRTSSIIPAVTSKGPKLQQLSTTLSYTSKISSNWGQSYELSNQEVHLNSLSITLASGLSSNIQMKQHIPDELNGDWGNAVSVNVPLRLSCVQNIFDDLSALRVTLGDMTFSPTQVYSYSQRNKDTSPEISANRLSGMYFWDGYYYHPTKKIGIGMQPYAILRIHHSSYANDRYMTYKVATPRFVQNTEQNVGRFYWPSSTAGEIIAQGVANTMGIDIQPAATGYTRTYCEIYIYDMYAALEPHYMRL